MQMSYEELIDWLFDNTDKRPQLGFGGKDKRSWLWLPGKTVASYEKITRVMQTAPLKGCSGCAYENVFQPMAGQNCEICFVALDIDAEDNPDGINLDEVLATKPSMVRTSCSGKGLHVIYRLGTPIKCTHETANKITKIITAPIVAALPTVKVCKSDKRLIWLFGGKNQILSQTDERLVVNLIPIAPGNMPPVNEPLFEVAPLIAEWASKLGVGIRKSTPVYVGDIIKRLGEMGEVIRTKSSMRGNGQVNGYIDITPTSISLWSYADGHVIWNLTDVEALCRL
jgi:hypothetical protein